MKRREFLECMLAAGAAVLCSTWRATSPDAANRQLAAAPPLAYPGPVVVLDEQKIRTHAFWVG